MTKPSKLKTGDQVCIVSPAKAIEPDFVLAASQVLQSWGLEVMVSKHALGRHHYFSGTDEERLEDLQWALDHPDFKAVFCARGGYGCVKLIESLDWTYFKQAPKWVVGYSDITVLHHQVAQFDIESIHGTMMFNFQTNSPEALETLKRSLFGFEVSVSAPQSPYNREGQVSGRLVGGNLSIIYSLLASPIAFTFKDCILFIEDIGEHVYQIDRMLHALKFAGVFRDIKGLVIGGMTEVQDTDVPYGRCVEDLVLDLLSDFNFPIAFDFPVGHMQDNRALVLGRSVSLSVNQQGSMLIM